jgi:very-short-patch-repair endonuclease
MKRKKMFRNSLEYSNLNKMVHGNTGKKRSIKTREKISSKRISLGLAKGKNNPMYGKKRSQKTKDKISSTRKEKIIKGEIIIWNKGKKNLTNLKHSDNWKEEHSKKLIGKKRPKHSYFMKEKNPFKGKKHSKKSIKKNSLKHIELWKKNGKEYTEKILQGLMKRPTSYEKIISNLCIENNLPFIYTGNGTFLIGHKNPDFIYEKQKIAIEVYHSFFKIRDFGSCGNYEKQRREYFSKYGWSVIFIKEDELKGDSWESKCLNKINSFIKQEVRTQ